jgi:hypothetical protein
VAKEDALDREVVAILGQLAPIMYSIQFHLD